MNWVIPTIDLEAESKGVGQAVMVYLGSSEVPKTRDWITVTVGLWELENPHAHCSTGRG